MKELDAVVLTRDIPSERLAAGDVGTIVHVHDGASFEVEFVEGTGDTVAVVTLDDAAIRPVAAGEVLHAVGSVTHQPLGRLRGAEAAGGRVKRRRDGRDLEGVPGGMVG